MENVWKKATAWEQNWWGDCSNTIGEEIKQFYYASLMGLDQYKKLTIKKTYQFELNGKSILDIGGGPTSLLLKSVNFKRAVVLDPCNYPQWIKDRYKTHNIEFINKKAEEIDLKDFDEVWIYNCLQHTEYPEKIIKNAIKAGKIVRLLEWVNTGTNVGHIHNLTKEFLDKYFNGRIEKLNKHGCFGNAYIAVLDQNKKIIQPYKRSDQKRFHLLGLAHVPSNKKGSNLGCAYTQKVIKMGQMLKSLGHYVMFYGVEGSEVECDEFIQVSTKEILRKCYGDYDANKETFKHAPNDLAYRTFNENAINEINIRKQQRDYLLVPFGSDYQKSICDAVNIPLTVEMGIGYRGIFAPFKVFESNIWRAFNYGYWKINDGLNYDCVIPNYFDPLDFEYSDKKENYHLYIGRVIPRKGIRIVIEAIRNIGGKLIIAGQKGQGVDHVNLDFPEVEYVGFADLEKRKKLMSKAKAIWCPTKYIEPFAGVHIEAAFSGTPVITSDFGVFSETVIQGVTGFRCSTLEQYIFAAKNIDKINPKDCRDYAMKNFTMKRIAEMYEEYFEMLATLLDKGWYTLNPERKNLDWLNKYYPKGVYNA